MLINEIKLRAFPLAKAGKVQICSFCGESAVGTGKFCSVCKTKKGRESIFDENQKILKVLRGKGFCLGEISFLLP
ncbi:hypothetical protein KAR28_04490 [Candidatus Parcubacteria bacterium]|nr:hypothetical protein [Candidatus Parcubacteria bacterium]